MDISDEKLEEVIEEKVEERVEERMKEERQKIREELKQQIEGFGKVSKSGDNKMTRRKFLKMLGVGAGGLALSSSVAGSWSIVRPSNQGASDINAEVASGLKSSVVGDGLKNGQSSALSVEPADFAGSYLQDDGNDNLEVDTSSIATRSWVNNNADVPNADYADSAGNADQLDGNDASTFLSSSDLTNHTNDSDAHHSPPTFATESGSGSKTINSDGTYTYTISFTNTYKHASPSIGIIYKSPTSYANPNGGFSGWITDSNNNITGMNWKFNQGEPDPTTATTLDYWWTVSGVIV